MTIQTETNKIVYDGLIGQTVFAYNFRVDQKEDMNVYLGGLIIAADQWTIDGIGEAVGGNVTLNTPLAVDQTVTLLREVDETQLIDYQPFDAFPAEVNEQGLDKLTMMVQQVNEVVNRFAIPPPDSQPGDEYNAYDLPYTAPGAGAVLRNVGVKLNESASVFDYMTAAEIADVQAGSLLVDVTAAIKTAIAVNQHIYLPKGKYSVSELLTFTGFAADTSIETASITGDGPRDSVLVPSDNTVGVIKAQKGNGNTQGWLSFHMEGVGIQYSGQLQSQSPSAIHLIQNFESTFTDVFVGGSTESIRLEGVGKSWFTRVVCHATNRPGGENLESIWLMKSNASVSRCFGIHMTDCENHGAPVADRIFDLRAVDGLYMSNCHWNTGIIKMHIRPDNTDLNDTVRQVHVSNCYFDGDTDLSGTPLAQAILIQSVVGTGTSDVSGLYFSNCFIREGESVLEVRGDPGFFEGFDDPDGVQDIMFNNCEFRGMESYYFYINSAITNVETVVNRIKISNCTFRDAPGDTGPNIVAVVFNGRNLCLQGSTFTGDWTDAGNTVVLVQDSSINVQITDNIFDVPRIGAVVVNAGATDVRVVGNIGQVDL